jgi:predicted aldo/keto reductase-like oxidoreductase
VLSGMSTMEQVKQNVASASQSGPGTLTADELALIARVRDKYRELCPIPCTQCRYCMPCPSGVNIPRVLEIYNEAIMYNSHQTARDAYNLWLNKEERADLCTQCAQCEEVCPQEIEIVEWLAQIHQLLDESQNQ